MEIVGILLVLGAMVGHVAFLSFSNNWWFAHPLPHRFLTCVRLLHGLLVLAGVTAFVLAAPLRMADMTAWPATDPWHAAAKGYTLLCLFVGLVWCYMFSLVHLV